MAQSIISGEEFKSTPKKQDVYNWVTNVLNIISPRDVVKAFLTSGISISLTGEEDALSENVQRLKKVSYGVDVIIKDDPEELKLFMKDAYAEEEDLEKFKQHYNANVGEDEEELTLDDNLDSLLLALTIPEEDANNDSDAKNNGDSEVRTGIKRVKQTELR